MKTGQAGKGQQWRLTVITSPKPVQITGVHRVRCNYTVLHKKLQASSFRSLFVPMCSCRELKQLSTCCSRFLASPSRRDEFRVRGDLMGDSGSGIAFAESHPESPQNRTL